MSTAKPPRRRRYLSTWVVAALSVVALLASATPTSGFGTIDSVLLGQSNEHERITRVALECPPAFLRYPSRYLQAETTPLYDLPGRCFERLTTDALAGRSAKLFHHPLGAVLRDTKPVGAVGAPDMDEFFDSVPHCDDGDFLAKAGYPRSRKDADTYLGYCRAYLVRHFQAALKHARDLVDAKSGAIVPGVLSERFDCRFVNGVEGLKRFNAFYERAVINSWTYRSLPLDVYVKRVRRYFKTQRSLANESAKCATLGHLGRVLHIAQDFYSHGNWTDLSDTSRPGGLDNPPGLGRTDRALLLDPLRKRTVITPGLITGCFSFPLLDECKGRIEHDDHLAKDKGSIGIRYAKEHPWQNRFSVCCVAGKHPRSDHSQNFDRAVRGAVQESRGLLKDFGKELIRLYPRDGETMICILYRDFPSHDCRYRVFRYRVKVELTGGASSWTHEHYARNFPNDLLNYRGAGSGSSSWKGEWRELQIRLNRTDSRVFSANTASSAFTGTATGEWTDRVYYNERPGTPPANGHTCKYDHQERRADAARIGALPLAGDDVPHWEESYDAQRLFTLVVSGPSVLATCTGFRTDPVRPHEHAYDGTYMCQFALDRFQQKVALPIRIPISELGDEQIIHERRFAHTAGGCGLGIGDPTEDCQGAYCSKGTKSRTGTLRVVMTLIKP